MELFFAFILGILAGMGFDLWLANAGLIAKANLGLWERRRQWRKSNRQRAEQKKTEPIRSDPTDQK